MTIAKACWYHDVRELGMSVTLFDELPVRTKCHYFELADYILSELELVV